MSRKILISAAILGAFGVMIGAFGAHGLKPLLVESGRLETFETAVKYHFYHTFALLVLGLIHERFDLPKVRLTFWLYISGILIFSGSLYALCLTNITFLGAITPIGGLLLVAGWISTAWSIKKAG